MSKDKSELVSNLLKNTKFEVAMDSRVLTNRLKVRTPVEVLNCIFGGGFPLGIVAHCYGEPRGGKSTLFYQTMGIFQKQYPEGIAVILDMEASADPVRLNILGVNASEVVRLPSTSIEDGFLQLMKLLKNKEENPILKNVPIFVIWDTISNGQAQDGSTQSRVNAMDRARIIKNYMPELQKLIEKHDFFLGLINQIIYNTDMYGNTKVGAGGGVALQHANQVSMFLRLKSSLYDDYNILTRRVGNMDIDKSKISPEMRNITYQLDVNAGGSILERNSFIGTMLENKFIDSGAAWVKHKRFYEHPYNDDLGRLIMDSIHINIDKSYRQDDLHLEYMNIDYMYFLLRHAYLNMIEDRYTLQRDVVRDYHNQIISELREMCLKDEVLDAETFDKYAYGLVSESSDLSEMEEELDESNSEES